jgi:hypothetical protein
MCVAALACGPLAAVARAAEPAPSPPSASSTQQPPAVAGDQVVPAKVRRYAERLLRQYDRNGDGVLQPDEWSKMRGNPAAIDANHDRVITLDELTRYIMAYGQQRRLNLGSLGAGWPPEAATAGAVPVGEKEDGEPSGASADGKGTLSAAPDNQRENPRKPRDSTFYVRPSRLPPGLPEWFTRRDTNGDGQLSLSEFAPNPTQADLEEFARYDKNGDGFITAQECLEALRPAKLPAKKKADKSAEKAAKSAAAKPKDKETDAAK